MVCWRLFLPWGHQPSGWCPFFYLDISKIYVIFVPEKKILKMETKIGIYCWKNIVTNKRYIGKTTNLPQRYRAFCRWCNIYSTSTSPIHCARQEFPDIKYWEYSVLENCDKEQLSEREHYWILTFDTTNPDLGYNISIGSEHNQRTKNKMSLSRKGEKCYWFGKHHSEETRQKLKENHTGERNVRFGSHHTEETKRKIADAQSGERCHWFGVTPSDETRQKLSDAHQGEKHFMYGKKQYDETRRKISETLKKNGSIPHTRPVVQIDRHTDEIIKIWSTISSASSTLKCSKHGICSVCKGKPKHLTAGGYKWRYATPEEIASLNNS